MRTDVAGYRIYWSQSVVKSRAALRALFENFEVNPFKGAHVLTV